MAPTIINTAVQSGNNRVGSGTVAPSTAAPVRMVKYDCQCVLVVKLTQTLVGVVGGGSSPRPVVVKRLADVTVVALRVVFTVTHQPPSAVLHTLTGVAVTLTPVRKHTHTHTLT